MKKYLFALGVALASAFTLTNCTEEIRQPNEDLAVKGSFEIIANVTDTKTVNDGMSTKWEAKDSINVFHAVAGSDNYVNDGKFTIAESDLEEGRFTGNLNGSLDQGGTYDWYAFFPYVGKMETPANTTAYAYIGHSKGLNQKGYDNTDALKRTVCPLYGVAEAVSGNKLPGIAMQHLSSVLAIEVTNGNDSPLTVTTASFTAPEDIVGSYYIDFSGEPVYVPSDGYTFSTATVNVSNGTELAKGKTAILYLAIKPFTAAAGSKLVLSVNGYEKELTLEKDVTFTAGKIKTLKFDYDYVEVIDGDKIEWTSYEDWTGIGEAEIGLESGDYSVVINKSSGGTNPTVNGNNNDCRAYAKNTVTISHSSKNITSLVFYLSNQGVRRLTDITPSSGEITLDAANRQVVWTGNVASVTLTVGEKATHGTDGTDKAGQLCFDYIVAKTGGAASNPDPEQPAPEDPTVQTVSISQFLAADVSETQLYRVNGTIVSINEISSQYKNATLTISDGTNELYIFRMKSAEGALIEELGLTVGDELTVEGLRGEHGGKPQMVNGVYVSHVDKAEPTPSDVIVATAAQFLAAAESATTIYRLTGTIVSVEDISTDYGNATLTISDGTGEVYVYRMKPAEGGKAIDQIGLSVGDVLTVEGNRGSYNGSPQLTNGFYVSHEDGEAPVSTADVVVDFSAQGYDNAQDLVTLTVDGITVAFEKGDNKNGPKYYNIGAAARVYGGNSFTVSAANNIAKIKFFFASGEGTNAITANTGTFSSPE